LLQGAFDDLVQLANTGRQQQGTNAPMLEIFQYELGRVEADLRTIRAFADVQIENHWRYALAGTLKGEALQTQASQAVTWVTSACVRVVDDCFRLGGGSALYDTSPLQRRMRDLRVAAQHAVLQYEFGQREMPSLYCLPHCQHTNMLSSEENAAG
jgi:indole-3-acetate monooxygenase